MDFETRPLNEEEEELIGKKIEAYADEMAHSFYRTAGEQLVFKVEDEEGKFIGGCILKICEWGRAVLAKLWVDEKYRKHGIGSMLIRAAEHAAREKGCYYLCLGTADYMARPLYEKHGFRVFTTNRDIPMGHVSWSLSKRLDRDVPYYVPTDNSAEGKYQVRQGSEEDAGIITEAIIAFCRNVLPEGHEYITLSKKLVDTDGDLVAAIICGVDEDDTADLDGIWVEEKYRRQGIGSLLVSEFEREAKENGAYVILTQGCDWVSGFFLQNGFTVRGELEDYPKGHTAYELEKRIEGGM